MIKGPCVFQFPTVGLHDGFYVTVGKASGERPYEQINTTQPEITLILSYSSYHLSISAVNNASTSPPKSLTVPRREEDIPSERSLIKAADCFFFFLLIWGAARHMSVFVATGAADRKLSVRVHSNKSFTVSWTDNLIQTYVCYSVEWRTKDHKACQYMSFYQDEDNNMTLSLSGGV